MTYEKNATQAIVDIFWVINRVTKQQSSVGKKDLIKNIDMAEAGLKWLTDNHKVEELNDEDRDEIKRRAEQCAIWLKKIYTWTARISEKFPFDPKFNEEYKTYKGTISQFGEQLRISVAFIMSLLQPKGLFDKKEFDKWHNKSK